MTLVTSPLLIPAALESVLHCWAVGRLEGGLYAEDACVA